MNGQANDCNNDHEKQIEVGADHSPQDIRQISGKDWVTFLLSNVESPGPVCPFDPSIQERLD